MLDGWCPLCGRGKGGEGEREAPLGWPCELPPVLQSAPPHHTPWAMARARYDGTSSRALYNGQLAGLAVFDAVLTADDVGQLYYAVRGWLLVGG